MTRHISFFALAFVLFFSIFSWFSLVRAECEGKFVNPITDVEWSCIYPIRMGGMNVSPSGPDPETELKDVLCSCDDGAFKRVGITFGFREPSRLMDVTKDSMCLAGLGIDMGNSSIWGDGGASHNKNKYSNQSDYFAQTHYYFFNPLFLMELGMDMKCMEKLPLDVVDMSEFRPDHGDEQLSLMLYPESVLFQNPPVQMSCMADSISSTGGWPLDSLFWCDGSWGTVYPMGGRSRNAGTSMVEASANVASSSLARGHRLLTNWGTKGPAALCGPYPQPVWQKTMYRFQSVRPVKGRVCPTVGRSGLMWDQNMNPAVPGYTDNFSYLIWRFRDCCTF